MSSAPKELRSLVQRFRRNQADYKNPAYNETQVRREFIDPLFKALGWDVDNEQGYAEAYKDVIHEDVIHEDAIKVGGATKALNYCFRIGRTRKFFLEAKKPAVPLKEHAESASLLLWVLTVFGRLPMCDAPAKLRPVRRTKPLGPQVILDSSERDLHNGIVGARSWPSVGAIGRLRP